MAKKKKVTRGPRSAGKSLFDFANWESMTGEQFDRYKKDAKSYYYSNSNPKELQSYLKSWMKANGYKPRDISVVTNNHIPPTIPIHCKLMLDGCPDFNEKENVYWESLPGTTGSLRPLSESIREYIDKSIRENKFEEPKDAAPSNVISIQDRMKAMVAPLLESFESYIDDWYDGLVKAKDFDPHKQMTISEIDIKAAHAKIIRDRFASMLEEANEVVEWKDDDLKEGYAHLATAKLRKEFASLYQKIDDACRMFIEKGKATRKPRKPKQISNEKLVAKMKYKAFDKDLSLVSVNPAMIIGAKELWVYNAKTRKLGHYIADEYIGQLSVKGTTIIGFDTIKSVRKTLRKPEETLREFSKANKVALRKFMSNIKSKESNLTGRINSDTILLKVS